MLETKSRSNGHMVVRNSAPVPMPLLKQEMKSDSNQATQHLRND
jgi:hypothetical protein